MAPRPGCLSRVKKGNVQRKHADAAECCWGNKNKAEAQDEQRRLCTSRIRTVALRGQTYAKSSTQYLHTNVIRMPALRVCVWVSVASISVAISGYYNRK